MICNRPNSSNIASLLSFVAVKKKTPKVNAASREGSLCVDIRPPANPVRSELCSQPGH